MTSTSRELIIAANKPSPRSLELATAVWSGMVIVSAVLASRKLAGALTEQVSPLVACLAVTGAAGLSLLAYLLFQWTRGAAARKSAQIAAGIVTVLPPFALGLILLPGHSPFGASYVTSLLLLAIVAIVALSKGQRVEESAGQAESGEQKDASLTSPSQPSASDSSLQKVEQPSIVNPQSSSDNRQWMTRSVGADGWECIEGAVKVDFAAGQKQAMIHLAFSPPLLEQPDVECEALDESDVRFKVAAVHPYGARIEAKRAGRSETAETVEVGFTAIAAAANRGAA
jgi:hypothetical protein